MNKNLNTKDFIKFIKTKITIMIQESFTLQNKKEDSDLIVNEIKSFLFSIINDQYISNTNKILFYFFFLELLHNHMKELIVEFLTQMVLKIKQKEISDENFIKNEYFLFKILSHKENIKILRNMYYDLFNVSLLIASKIYEFPESKSIFKEDDKVINFIKQENKKINEILNIDNNLTNYTNYSLVLKYPKIMQNILNSYEDKYIDIINNKNFFEKKDNGIFITESFKNFFSILLGINVENISFNISSDYVLIKEQFEIILSNFQPFA